MNSAVPHRVLANGHSNRSYGGHSMALALRKVLICPPGTAGWSKVRQTKRWEELGYHHPPDLALAQAQHDELQRLLEETGTEVFSLTDSQGLSLDAVYAHDASFITDDGAISLRMGKPARSGEPARHTEFYQSQGIPILGEIKGPGTAEAGDMVWLDRRTLLVGYGYRTNAAGIAQLEALLGPKGIEVIVAPLPHGWGPASCLHLMSLMSILDEQRALVDLPWLSVQTVELLQQRDFKLLEIDASERDTLACNVLALGNGKLIAMEHNSQTNLRLKQKGFDVKTFPGSEICLNGSGGPTCLTRPLLRG